MRHPVVPYTSQALLKMDTPDVVEGGNLEAFADVLYSHALFTSNVTTELEFFTADGNRRVTNAVRQLSSPQYFMVFGIHVDYYIDPAATAWQDAWQLQNGVAAGVALVGGPTFTFTYADKDYGPWPLSCLHGTGALTGFGTANDLNYVNNYIPDGGFFQDGGLLLAPNQGFRGMIQWPAAVLLNRGHTQIKVTLSGTRYRKIT